MFFSCLQRKIRNCCKTCIIKRKTENETLSQRKQTIILRNTAGLMTICCIFQILIVAARLKMTYLCIYYFFHLVVNWSQNLCSFHLNSLPFWHLITEKIPIVQKKIKPGTFSSLTIQGHSTLTFCIPWGKINCGAFLGLINLFWI